MGELKEKKKEEMVKERNISEEIDQICASVTGVSLNPTRKKMGSYFQRPLFSRQRKKQGKTPKKIWTENL